MSYDFTLNFLTQPALSKTGAVFFTTYAAKTLTTSENSRRWILANKSAYLDALDHLGVSLEEFVDTDSPKRTLAKYIVRNVTADVFTLRATYWHTKELLGFSCDREIASIIPTIVSNDFQDGTDQDYPFEAWSDRIPLFRRLKESERSSMKVPSDMETGECVKTPRGVFHITAVPIGDMEAMGFGPHHYSDDGKYAILGNGSIAYAVRVGIGAELEIKETASYISRTRLYQRIYHNLYLDDWLYSPDSDSFAFSRFAVQGLYDSAMLGGMAATADLVLREWVTQNML